MFNGGYALTRKGEALQTKVLAGTTTLNLTHMDTGSGNPTSMNDYYDRTDLLHTQNAMTISSKTASSDDSHIYCTVTSALNNTAVQASYMASELGLYAKDTDDTEILYAVSCDANPMYVPSKEESADLTITFDFILLISGVDKINLTLPATAAELASLVSTQAVRVSKDAATASSAAKSASTDAAAAQTARSGAETARTQADASATAASTSAGAAAKSAQQASTSATAAMQASDGATAALAATKKQADRADAAGKLVDKIEADVKTVSDQLQQAQSLATASAGIQIYEDTDGDLAYRLVLPTTTEEG